MLAHDLRHSRSYPEALSSLKQALELASGEVRPVLHAFEAELLSCLGDTRAFDALLAFAKSRKHTSLTGLSSSTSYEVVLQELDLLRRVLKLPGTVPPSILSVLSKKYQSIVSGLLNRGPWVDAYQLPHQYSPGLAPLPLLDVGSPLLPHFVAQAASLLESSTELLIKEYEGLRTGGYLWPETECIAEPKWLSQDSIPSLKHGQGAPFLAKERGSWWVYISNVPWVKELDTGGCSLLTPVACDVFSRVRSMGLQATRVGFSVLEPGAHLHPHYGATNTHLKFHLGLKIPQKLGGLKSCASLMVGNKTVDWQVGKVLFFDDSHLHSVDFPGNGECGEQGERVVLQLVFRHPLLDNKNG